MSVVFHTNVPFMTPEKLAEATGLTERQIINMIDDGRLPRLRTKNDGTKEKILVNLVGCHLMAAEQGESFIGVLNGN